MAKVAANPFHDWSYSNINSTATPPTLPKDPTPTIDVPFQNTKPTEVIMVKTGARRGRKRIHPIPRLSPEPEGKRIAIESRNTREKEKENKNEKELKDQIQLQEFYYATMEGDKNQISKEYKSSLYFKVCSKLIVLLSTCSYEKYVFRLSVSSARR